MPSPNELSAVAAAQAIAAGELTSEALTQACLDRIAAREPAVEAWAHVDAEVALAQARQRDEATRSGAAPRGPLHGLPVAFKDVIETVDLPTSYGSPIYPGARPLADASCVALVRAMGGVVLGKTVTTEFAVSNPGKTRNPHDPAHTPGGSSSGSAAAVADFMVPLAFGTQTGGSVIRPASFCGVVGYKPTIGQFSYAGVKLLARSLDTLGAMSRAVADLALLRAALLGAPAEVSPLAQAPRIALCRTPWWDKADGATHAVVERAAERLAMAGGTVDELVLPEAFAALGPANRTIMMYEGRRALAYEFAQHEDKLSRRLKEGMGHGLTIPFADYRRAIDVGQGCRRALAELLRAFDAMLVPSAVGEAPKGLDSTGDAIFNRPWTTTGVPCVTLPGATGPHGLPVGVQLVAPYGRDEHLLSVAAWAEAALAAAPASTQP